MRPTFIQDSPVSRLQHLRRLSAVKSERALTLLTPAADPGSHCPMHTILTLAGRIDGVSTLVIGMPECGTYSKMVIPEPYGKQGELHWHYLLDGNEVVFGCSKGLGEALKEMDAAGARAILLLVTCIPDLIAEDVNMLVDELQPQLSARLAAVPAAHFACSSYPPGYWRTLEAIGTFMEEPGGPPAGTARTVNIMSFGTSRDAAGPELEAMLNRQGDNLRFLNPSSTLDVYMEAPQADLNLVLSPNFVPLAAAMERRFGIPAVHLHSAHSCEDIDRAYERIADILDFQWKDSLHPDRAQLLRLECQAEECVKGITFIVTEGRVDPLPLAAYLTRLGMEPLLLHMEGFGQGDKAWAKAITQRGHDPWVCHMVNPASDAKILADLAPGLCVGRPLVPRSEGTVYLEGLPPSGTAYGYARSVEIVKSLCRTLQHE